MNVSRGRARHHDSGRAVRRPSTSRPVDAPSSRRSVRERRDQLGPARSGDGPAAEARSRRAVDGSGACRPTGRRVAPVRRLGRAPRRRRRRCVKRRPRSTGVVPCPVRAHEVARRSPRSSEPTAAPYAATPAARLRPATVVGTVDTIHRPRATPRSRPVLRSRTRRARTSAAARTPGRRGRRPGRRRRAAPTRLLAARVRGRAAAHSTSATSTRRLRPGRGSRSPARSRSSLPSPGRPSAPTRRGRPPAPPMCAATARPSAGETATTTVPGSPSESRGRPRPGRAPSDRRARAHAPRPAGPASAPAARDQLARAPSTVVPEPGEQRLPTRRRSPSSAAAAAASPPSREESDGQPDRIVTPPSRHSLRSAEPRSASPCTCSRQQQLARPVRDGRRRVDRRPAERHRPARTAAIPPRRSDAP